jgi:SAM-dependent methyltransferase
MSVVCPLCESRDARAAFQKSGYAHFECASCRALFVSPRPSSVDIVQFYRHHAGDAISRSCWSGNASSHRHWHRTWRRLLSKLQTQSGLGPLLDLGSGTGQFLAFAREQGWRELTGVELLPEAAESARKLVEAEIHVGDLAETTLPADRFAAVFLWDILEHLGDVRSVLKEVQRVLRPGGSAVLGTVNRDGLSLRAFKERALTVSPPEHLTFFTSDGLSKAMSAAGLELEQAWSEAIYLREWAPRADAERYPEWRSKLSSGRSFRAAMWVGNLALRLTHLGDELIAVARKRKTEGHPSRSAAAGVRATDCVH